MHTIPNKIRIIFKAVLFSEGPSAKYFVSIEIISCNLLFSRDIFKAALIVRIIQHFFGKIF
jgi:hypothetical protein